MKDRLCFVIGPMGPAHFPKFLGFVETVIKPVFEPLGFEVRTPDQGGVGSIMKQVIEACDRAELVIADLTGNNPNVSYEVGLLDALGRMCIPVKLDADDERVMFDRADYRFWKLKSADVEASRATLLKAYNESVSDIQTKEHFSNPLTDYYKVPVIELSPTAGLALGYCENFLKGTLRNMTEPVGRDSERKPLYKKIFIKEGDRQEEITGQDREEIMIDVVIPDRLQYATHRYISSELLQKGIIEKAKIVVNPDEHREMTLYAWKGGTGKWHLLDIPTTMNVITQSIHYRRGLQMGGNQDKEFRDLEVEEIERFWKLLRRNTHRSDQDLTMTTRCRLLRWSDTELTKAQVV